MPRNSKDFTYDNNLLLKDAGAVTTSGADQVSGSAKVITLGAGRVDGRVIVDISAITDNGATQESYIIIAQFSTSPTFASGVVNGTALFVGGAATTNQSASDAAPMRKELAFTNEHNGVVYPYMRLFRQVAGTAPSINYVAYAVQEPL